MTIRDKYVKVREAARLLGVCPNTIRTWGAEGKIPESRHPVNNYRLYKRTDLDRLMRKLEKSADKEPLKAKRSKPR